MVPTQVAAVRSLVKPRIVGLLCVTGASAHLAAGGTDPARLMVFVVAGGMIAGGAAALNCVYDRDIDRLMDRTADRPLPAGDIVPSAALAIAIVLLLTGTMVGLVALPPISVAWMHLGMVAYLGLYTVLLKRRHPIAVVLGGSAGSFPVLAGWTAVRPLGPEALLMAGLVFVWTPAHAWTLAVVYREDFAAASIPTLPVVADQDRIRRAVGVSALLTVGLGTGLLLFGGRVSAVAAATAGPLYLLAVRAYHRTGTKPTAVRAFFSSNLYLAVLFAAWAVDGLGAEIPWSAPPVIAAAILGAFLWLWTSRPELGGVRAPPTPAWRSSLVSNRSFEVGDFRS